MSVKLKESQERTAVRWKRPQGFTLAELLISLAILGVIATFTIPKILSAQQASANVAKAKEVAAMISEAYQKAQADGVITANTKPADLIQYMNYVKLDTSGTLVDAHPNWVGIVGAGRNSCSPTTPCLHLHNGGILLFHNQVFSGTSNLHYVDIAYDPDQVTSGSTNDAPTKSVQFSLYYNGFLTTRGQVKTGSICNFVSAGLDASFDPSWFSWN